MVCIHKLYIVYFEISVMKVPYWLCWVCCCDLIVQCLSSGTRCRWWRCPMNWHVVHGYLIITLSTHCSGATRWIRKRGVKWVLISCCLLVLEKQHNIWEKSYRKGLTEYSVSATELLCTLSVLLFQHIHLITILVVNFSVSVVKVPKCSGPRLTELQHWSDSGCLNKKHSRFSF